MTDTSSGRRWSNALRWIAALGAAAVLAACGGGSAHPPDGALRLALTDAPSCYQHVYVTVEKLRLHGSATADEADLGWTELALPTPQRIDLARLSNGVLQELATLPLAAGQYRLLRLVLAENAGTGPGAMVNAVRSHDGTERPLETPSTMQSGLKLRADLGVAPGQTADLLLDFDACRSVVPAGNSGTFILKPVLSVVPRIASGIAGYLTTTLSLSSTTVAAQQNGTTVRSTSPDGTGFFSIPYLQAGTYTLVVTSEAHAMAVVTNVPVGTATTVINGTSTAIAPPSSPMGEITGSVTANSVSLDGSTMSVPVTGADVRAMTSLIDDCVTRHSPCYISPIETTNRAVDPTNGRYRLRVPIDGYVRADFQAGAAAFDFRRDSRLTGWHGVEVSAPNRPTMMQSAYLGGATGSTTATVNFTY